MVNRAIKSPPVIIGLTPLDRVFAKRRRLDQLFAAKFSRSAGREITRQRIERAKRLLTATDKPMKEIAALCGFCNAGYFTNTFRAAAGMTPKAWRRQA